MLGDKIKESDIFDILHSDDGMKIIEAKGILKQAPINGFLSGDNIDRIWFDKNIQSQESLLQLKVRIDALISSMQIELYKLEGECLQSGEYEFVKAREERIALMIANEPVLRDKKTSIEKLRSISYYVDGLLWSLRDLMKLFKK